MRSVGRRYKSLEERKKREDDYGKVLVLAQILRAQGWKNRFVDVDELIREKKLVCEDIGISYRKMVSIIERMRLLGMVDVETYQVGSEKFSEDFVGYEEIPIWGSKVRVNLKGLELVKKHVSTKTRRDFTRNVSGVLKLGESLKKEACGNIDRLIDNEKRRLREEKRRAEC